MEVHLQTERLGWHTDDFLIIGQTGSGVTRKLAGQAKRRFTVSTADAECRKAILDFWRDFKQADPFACETDRLALVTLRGTTSLLEHFGGLLDCARAARDGSEFERRLNTPGLLAAPATRYCQALRTIVSDGSTLIAAADIWPFLRVLYLLNLDLQTSTAQNEAAIKTLLAFTTDAVDSIGAAASTWNSLVVLASGAMPEGRSFRRDDLPDELRARHSVIRGIDHKALQALGDHGAPVLAGIRSTIGSYCRLSRAGLAQTVISELETSQIVVITGAAGYGKSAIAKEVMEQFSKDHLTFAFRAEEFAQPHIDATLQNAQIPLNISGLRALLAAQISKVLLLESVERLLEKSTRDAFGDLLRLAAGDSSFRIILTCRDYSSDQVRRSFLGATGIPHSVVVVPPLDDTDLEEVVSAYPDLARPLAHPPLRRILRNPYLLDKALQISWATDRPLPESERGFRALFWREIVRVDSHPAGGLPRKREEVLQEVSVRRARALAAYVTSADLDAAVIELLRQDSLLTSQDQSPLLVAPAHDVLEDWAILQWIEQQHAAREGSFRDLSSVIGAHPAMRRAYRKWIGELLDRDPTAADRLFRAAAIGSGVTAQFRDDTLVSLLRAASTAEFLARHKVELLADKGTLLKRVIHLLRVACVASPTWLRGLSGHASLFNVPDGPAWPSVLELVQHNLGAFQSNELSLLLGLIEDAARNVSWREPDPAGAEFVAGIAHWLLPRFGSYKFEELRKRTLQVIAKVPKANPTAFAAVLARTKDDSGRVDRTAETLRRLLFSGLDGLAAARDLPELVVTAAMDYLLTSEEELQRDRYYGESLDLQAHFGLREALEHDFFPASALRGPWTALLKYHPSTALEFLQRVFNHSADWYAHPRVRDAVEAPFEVVLTFADGLTRKQWASSRFWNLYRATSVGPHALQSLLMALERWLLDIAEERPQDLDGILMDILRGSESAAVSAVIAAVATASPHASGQTLLVFLRATDYVLLDRQRLVSESQAPSRLAAVMPRLSAHNELYENERKQADSLSHRREDLEMAITALQLGPLAPRVQEILDEHRAAMPPLEEQTELHRVWRLALHRMDLRQYTRAVVLPDEMPQGSGADSVESKSYVRLDQKPPDADVQEMVTESAVRLTAMNQRVDLTMWGLRAFKREAETDTSTWSERLAQAQAFDASEVERSFDVGQGAPGLVAAVCVRDHWDALSEGDRAWCVDRVCWEIVRQASNWDQLARVQRYEMAADRSCAWVVPALLGKSLSETQMLRAHEAFAAALTHPVQEVRWYAAWGVAQNLWAVDADLTLRAVNAIAAEATAVASASRVEGSRPYDQRRKPEGMLAEAAASLRQRFWQPSGIPDDACGKLDLTDWYGSEAIGRVLAILGEAPADVVAIAVFARAAHSLVEQWDASEDRRSAGHSRDRHFDHELVVSERLQHFAMRATPATAELVLRPLIEAIDRHPREIYTMVRGLISIEDSQPNTPQFWFLWNLFANGVRRASWVPGLDAEHPTGSEMIQAVFLGASWKPNVRHWRSLEGNAHHVHSLFEALPPTAEVLDDYVRFLYHVGEQSLPDAFLRVVLKLRATDPHQMLRKADTVFMLEVLLQRHVYGRPLELKRDPEVRGAVLDLLDILVEHGSSASFRMRDDFVTPVSAA